MFGANEPFNDKSMQRKFAEQTHNHLIILRNPNPFPLHHLQILQPTQHIMLHHELSFHAETRAFLDGEGLAFQLLDGAGRGQVDGDIRAAVDFQAERSDHAAALVGGVDGDAGGVGDAEGGFPAFEGFVVLILGGDMLGLNDRLEIGQQVLINDIRSDVRISFPLIVQCSREVGTKIRRQYILRYFSIKRLLPSFVYSSTVFFSPTLNPSVFSGWRSSSALLAMLQEKRLTRKW